MSFKNILCPIDFSEGMDKIIEIAIGQISEEGKLLFLNQIETIDFSIHGRNLEKDTESIKIRQKEIEHLIQNNRLKNPFVEFHYELCYDNNLVEEVKSIVENHQIDLIVMGSHGRSGLSKFLFGSISESVLENVNCSILIVKI
jgi:nucleotide-binding universal stress UspA family protein